MSPRRTPAATLCVLALLSMLLVGCAPREEIARAEREGAQTGYDKGWRDGVAEGYNAAFGPAEDEAYARKLEELYGAGKYQLAGPPTAVAIVGFFALGFLLQWLVLLGLRQAGLGDIDGIVLTERFTKVVTTALILVVVCGCDPVNDAWHSSYDQYYPAGQKDGKQAGEQRGRADGEKKGIEEAVTAAQTGSAWQLYLRLAVCGLLVGLIVGLSAQYITLWWCHDAASANVPSLLVPGIKSSRAFQMSEQSRELKCQHHEQIARIDRDADEKIARIKIEHDAWVGEMQDRGDCEAERHSQILERAKKDLAAVIASPCANAARSSKRRFLRAACPSCRLQLRFMPHVVRDHIKCRGCGSRITLTELALR